MKKLVAISLAVLALSACAGKAEREEKKLDMVRKTGDRIAICQQARKVADAYLDEGNQTKYLTSKVTADLDCQSTLIGR